MSEASERYEKVAAGFTARVEAVPPAAWDSPAPCEGWVARDVVGHLVEWVPAFFTTYAGLAFPPTPSVDADPAAAWRALRDHLQGLLDDPDVAGRRFELRGSEYTVEQAVSMFCVGDILVHTSDLARATGLDEALDPDEVRGMLAGLEPMDEALRQSGHYGPRVEVAPDADEQARLIAFTGRHP